MPLTDNKILLAVLYYLFTAKLVAMRLITDLQKHAYSLIQRNFKVYTVYLLANIVLILVQFDDTCVVRQWNKLKCRDSQSK